MIVVARYFATLPLLINISEDVELASKVNVFNNTDQDYLGKLSDTIDLVAKKTMLSESLKTLMLFLFNSPSYSNSKKTVLELTDKFIIFT